MAPNIPTRTLRDYVNSFPRVDDAQLVITPELTVGSSPVSIDGVDAGTAINIDQSNPQRPSVSLDIASQAEAEAGVSSVKGMTPLRTRQAIAANVTLAYLDRFYVTDWDQAFADAFTWAESSGVPLGLSPDTEYEISEPIIFREGVKIVNPNGILNPATRTTTPPRQAGLAKIAVAPGFSGDAVVFPGEAYNSGMSGVFLDCTEQVSGRGVVFSDDGYTSYTFRPNNRVTDTHIYNPYGTALHIEEWNHEGYVERVFASDSRTGDGVLNEGGDTYMATVWAAYNKKAGHHLLNTAALRGWGIEGWQNDEENHLWEGSVRGCDIFRMISDNAGQHGWRVKMTTAGPNNSNVYGLNIAGSSRLSDGVYDDFHVEQALVSGRVGLTVHGARIGSTSAHAWMTKSGIGATALAVSQYRELIDIRVNNTVIVETSMNAVVDDNALKAIQFQNSRVMGASGWEELITKSSVETANLVENGDFTHWDINASSVSIPIGWYNSGTGTSAQETTGSAGGGAGAIITAGAGVLDGLRQNWNAIPLRGKRVTVWGWAHNPTGESAANNTRIRLASGTALDTYAVPSDGKDHFFRLTIDVPTTATIVELLATPSYSSASSGRMMKLGRVGASVGYHPIENIGPHPATRLSWHDYSLTPFSGINAAIDLRYGGERYRITCTAGAVNLVGLVNKTTAAELLFEFKDALATIKFSAGSLKRADGRTDDFTPTAGQLLRAVWDGKYWVFTLPAQKQLLTGSGDVDPPSMANAGAAFAPSLTVTGAALGDEATATFSADLQGVTLTAHVSAANTVKCVFLNLTGTTVDLPSGTLRAFVRK